MKKGRFKVTESKRDKVRKKDERKIEQMKRSREWPRALQRR